MKRSEPNSLIRSILIIGYIVAVLLVSGLARAEQAVVQEVNFDASTFALHIQGEFASTCQTKPRPEFRVTNEDGSQTVSVSIETTKTSGVCEKRPSGHYDLVYDIRTLGLPVGGVTNVKFENAARQEISLLSVQVPQSLDGFTDATVERAGRLVVLGSLGFSKGPQYAVIGNSGGVTLITSLIDLDHYIDSEVRISGIPLNHSVAPAIDEADLDYGSKRGSAEPDLVFVSTIEVNSVPLQ